MKKSFLILSAVFLGLTACSSTPKNPVDATPGRTADVEFLEANGPLTLTFDEKGNWLSIRSSATAPLVNNAPEGVEIAFKTATMRAKRNLAEFMSNDVKSTKSVQTISKSYLKNIAQVDSSNESNTSGDDEDAASNSQATKESRQKANTIAQKHPDAIVIGSDQVAWREGAPDIFISKPLSTEKAIRQLQANSDKIVYFSTALSVQQYATGFEQTLVEHYKVKFRKLSMAEIERYVAVEQPLHCAGSFKCESLGISLFEQMIGQDQTTLMGMPMIQLCQILRQLNILVP